MKKNVSRKLTQRENPYQRIAENIYKTGSSYRIRVGKYSAYEGSKKDAFSMRKLFREFLENDKNSK